MADSSEISRLQSEIASLNAERTKCSKAINQVTVIIGYISSGCNELISTKNYLSGEYPSKRTDKIIDTIDMFEANTSGIKNDAVEFKNELIRKRNSLDSQISRKREKLADLKAALSEE